MRVELVSVGTELLMGNIVNTNAQYLSRKCALLGFSVYYESTVGDNPGRMREVIGKAIDRSDLVILSGGLGPTEDDITKDICAEIFGMPMKEHEGAMNHLKERYRKRGLKEIPPNMLRQAMIPEGAITFPNDNGTALGIGMEKDGKMVILLPGPPREMIPMMENEVIPYLASRSDEVILSDMVKISGIGESQVEMELLDLIDAQKNPTIATYAKPRQVEVRVTAKAPTEEEARALLRPVTAEIHKRFGNAVFTDEESVTLEDALVKILREKNLHVAFAESCTGGLAAATLINAAGASEVLSESYITYSDEAKHHLLGVPRDILSRYTAVSPETARAMAEGAVRASGADLAVSVTGIAGPDGGTPEKPVGLVYFGICANKKTETLKMIFSGNRATVREQAAVTALSELRKAVIREYGAD